MTWDPGRYGDVIEEIPGYEELQDAVAAAATGRNVLELGTGTGETALRVLARNPGARWTGIDGSEAMAAHARERLPGADLRVQRLEDPLPEGPFDLVAFVRDALLDPRATPAKLHKLVPAQVPSGAPPLTFEFH